MPRGGYYPHAKRWGRKSKWLSESATTVIRVPESIAEKVLEVAHKIDQGEVIDSDTETESIIKAQVLDSDTKTEEELTLDDFYCFWILEEYRKRLPQEIYKEQNLADYLRCSRPVINKLIAQGHSEFKQKTKELCRNNLKRLEVWNFVDDYDPKQGRLFYLVEREEKFAQALKKIKY